MPKQKLTTAFCKSIQGGAKHVDYWDTELPGFGLRVTKAGTKSFCYRYRRPGAGREASQAFVKIARYGEVSTSQARDVALKMALKVKSGEDPSTSRRTAPETIATLGKKYLDWMAVHRKPGSHRQAEIMLRVHILPKIGYMRVKDLARRDIRKMTKGMTPRTEGKSIQVLRAMLNKAEIDEAPWDQSMTPGTTAPLFAGMVPHLGNKRDRALSKEEMDRVLAVIATDENPWHAALFKLAIFTGARIGELKTAKWDWFKPKKQTIELPDSKTGKRTVHLNEAAMEVLENLDPRDDSPYIIPGHLKGSHLVNHMSIWKRYCKEAGIDNATAHDLRHSFASTGISAGLTLAQIGLLLGHSQPQTTQRYAHLVPDEANALANRVEKQIRKKEKE